MYWILILKVFLVLIWLIKWRAVQLIVRRTRAERWSRPIIKRSGFFSNRFPGLMEWGLVILILSGFFDFGTIRIQRFADVVLRVSGGFIFTAGAILKVSAVKALHTNHSFQVLFRRGQQLIIQGPYRYVRHPEYLADILLYAGLALSLLSYPAFGFTVLIYAPLLSYRAGIEERLLISAWGAAYRKYQRQVVGKLWPFGLKSG